MELVDFNRWLLIVTQVSGLSAILFFLFTRKESSPIAKSVFLVVAASMIADCSNYFFIRIVTPNSYYIGNSWYLINMALSAFVFYHLKPDLKKQLIGACLIFYVGSIVSFISSFSFAEANTFIRVSTSVISVYFALQIYFALLRQPSGKLRFNPAFWVANSYLLYGTITLFKNLFSYYLIFDLVIDEQAYAYIHMINLLSLISKHIILFYALILIDKGYHTTLKTTKAS